MSDDVKWLSQNVGGTLMAPVESDEQFLDRCAIAAMQGMEAAESGCGIEFTASHAYKIADAMLAERTKRRANRGG